MPAHWNFREATDQVYQLLRDLSQNLPLWGRFFDAPILVTKDYGLSVPQGIIKGNLCFRQRPSAALFSSELDWAVFDDKYLSNDGGSIKTCHAYRAIEAEILLTLKGMKPAARLTVREDHLGAIIHFLERRKVPFVLSPFKIVSELDEKKRNYSNRILHNLSFTAQSQGEFLVYLSLSGARAQATLLLNTLGATYELGRALGYPECCIKFFDENYVKATETQGDLAPFSVQNTPYSPPYPFYLNNLARYFGVTLIYHFPCRYTCTASAALGRQHLAVLQSDAPETAKRIQKLLICPIIYTDTKGVFLLEEFDLLPDGCLAYNPERIRATDETTELYDLLCASDKLRVADWDKGRLAFYQTDKLIGDIYPNAWCVTFTNGL